MHSCWRCRLALGPTGGTAGHEPLGDERHPAPVHRDDRALRPRFAPGLGVARSSRGLARRVLEAAASAIGLPGAPALVPGLREGTRQGLLALAAGNAWYASIREFQPLLFSGAGIAHGLAAWVPRLAPLFVMPRQPSSSSGLLGAGLISLLRSRCSPSGAVCSSWPAWPGSGSRSIWPLRPPVVRRGPARRQPGASAPPRRRAHAGVRLAARARPAARAGALLLRPRGLSAIRRSWR